MSWAKIDDGFSDHPKVVGCSLQAIGLWTLCISWASGRKTGGVIPLALPQRFGDRTGRATQELLRCGLWERSGDDIVIHDFGKYGPPADLSAKRAEAGRAGGLAKQTASKPEAIARQTASSGNPVPVPEPIPVPRTVLVAPTGATTLPEVIPQALQDHEVGAGSTQGPGVRVKRGPIRGEIVRGPTAGDLVGAFVDACARIGVEPIPRDKARVGRDCKELLAAGKSPELISAALERMVNRSRPVSALIGLVGEIERERAGHPLSRAAQNGKGDLVEITEKLRRHDGDGGATGEALGDLPGLVAGGYVAQHGGRAGGVADDAWGREPGRGG